MAGSGQAEAPDSAAIFEAHFDALARQRARRAGNRWEPEAPTLVAKMVQTPGKGELYLGGIPRQGDEAIFGRLPPFSMQIHCMKKPPPANEIHPGVYGRVLPGALLFKFEVSNASTRRGDYRRFRACLLSGLRQGECAYVHCMAGVHRAAVASAIMRSDLYGESWAAAAYMITRVRNVDFPQALERESSEWWAEL